MAEIDPTDALAALEEAFGRADLPAIRSKVAALEKSHPRDARVGVARARLMASEGDVAGAVVRLEKLVPDAKHGALARGYLGALKVGQRKHEEGRPLLEAALAAGVDVPPVRHALGVATLAMGDAKAAVPHLVKASEGMPGMAATYFYLGVALAELGQWDHAAEALRACISIAPQHEEAYDAAAHVELSAGRPEKARAILEAGLKANKDSVIILRAQADVLGDLGDAKGALAALNRLPAKQRGVTDLVALSLMAMGTGDWGAGLKHAEAAVKADATAWRAHYALGLALEAQQPLPRARVLACYRKAVELGDRTGEAGTRLGFMLMEDESPAAASEAVKVLEAAVERSAEAPGTVLNLALAYARNKQGPQAKAMCGLVLADARASASVREQAERLRKTLG